MVEIVAVYINTLNCGYFFNNYKKKKLMKNDISKWVNLKSCSLNSIDFADKCRQKLSDIGVLPLPQFLLPEALNQIIKEAQAQAHLAYFTKNTHNVYLSHFI